MDEQRYEELKAVAVGRWTIGAGELLALAQPQAFLIEKAIPKRGITFISGAPGGAKSWAAYGLVMSVIHGTPWLNRAFVDADETTSGVLVLNYDNPTPECARRYEQLGLQPGDPVRFHTLSISDPNAHELRFPGEEDLEQLHMVVGGLRPKLVLIDSFRQAHLADENDSKAIAEVMRSFRSLLAFGATVVVLHHTTKSGGALRGSGEITAAADAVIEITGDEEGGRCATWTKNRGWPMPMNLKQVAFDLVDHKLADGIRTELKVTG